MSDCYSLCDIHGADRDAVLQVNADQARELTRQPDVEITCPCGASGPLRESFQCLYCGIHFCPNCAYDHFGEDEC